MLNKKIVSALLGLTFTTVIGGTSLASNGASLDENDIPSVPNGVSDKLSGEFAGKFGTNVNLGVQADKGPATIGVRYGFTGGTKGKADHMFKLEARYRF